LKQFPTVAAEIADRPAAAYYADDNRTNLSNAAVDFIYAGKVDEAEQPARDLLVRSPTCTMITIPSAWSAGPEAITVSRLLPQSYRRHWSLLDDHDPTFRKLVDRLDPSAAA
jgi:hypothetical protein